jgi:hypothetical protein
VRRLLLLFHEPRHLRADDARAWVEEQVGEVLHGDGLRRAKLTRLGPRDSRAVGGFDWLLEFPEAPGDGYDPRSSLAAMVADLRLLGMAPLVAVADDQNAVELRAP